MTIDWNLYLRYFLEYAMVFPGACFAAMVVRDSIRPPFPHAAALILVHLFISTLMGAMVSVVTGIPTASILSVLTVLSFFPVCSLCRYSRSKILFVYLFTAMIAIWACTTVGYFFIRTESEIPTEPFSVKAGLTCLAIFILTLAAFYFSFRRKLPQMFEMEQMDRLWKYAFLVPLFWTVFFDIVMPDYDAPPVSGQPLFVIILSLNAIVVLLFGVLRAMWYLGVNVLEKENLKQENRTLKIEEIRYQNLQEYVENSRTQRHNFRQHLRVITQLAAENEMEPLREYLSEFSESVNTQLEEFCRNRSVDALASWYQNVADQRKIEIRWALEVPEELPVHNNDLCMILGNLLENALRVTEELPEPNRIIKVRAGHVGEHMFGMVVSNPFRGVIQFGEDGLPVRRGENGIGLRSISALVNNQKGNMMIETDSGWFTVNILFNI